MGEHEVECSAGHAASAACAQLLVGQAEVQVGEGVRAPEVVRGEGVEREAVREKPARERRPDDDAEAPVERVGKQVLLVARASAEY